jgi:hypothetical protein
MGSNLQPKLSKFGEVQPQQEEWSYYPKLHLYPRFLGMARLVLQLNRGKHTLSIVIQHEYQSFIFEE